MILSNFYVNYTILAFPSGVVHIYFILSGFSIFVLNIFMYMYICFCIYPLYICNGYIYLHMTKNTYMT